MIICFRTGTASWPDGNSAEEIEGRRSEIKRMPFLFKIFLP
jgi:hypothetical protein